LRDGKSVEQMLEMLEVRLKNTRTRNCGSRRRAAADHEAGSSVLEETGAT
jgi:hypothetical protein